MNKKINLLRIKKNRKNINNNKFMIFLLQLQKVDLKTILKIKFLNIKISKIIFIKIVTNKKFYHL